MRLKSAPFSCAFAWAPSSLGAPSLLATVSLAGATDDDFSNEAFLEIRLVDVTKTDETDMPVVGRTQIPERAYRVDWSSFGSVSGMIAVACGNGAVYVYDSDIIMRNYKTNPHSNTQDPQICAITEHRGAVRGCQFNPSQPHFLAIGADDGEWDVWTLEYQREPQRVPVMGNAAHTAGIVHLQWHPKYPHIIATASANGVVHVWNLKSQSLAVTLNVSKGSKSGVSANAIAWHPTVATQIAVALDEKDPAVQIWDLKKSMIPLREMRGHEGAVTGLAWSAQDASMIASCGADGRTIWWDPATGERSGELQGESGYMVDVQWSPVLQAVLATSSFEPRLCVSTAEDTAAVPGTTTAAVPKWLKKPCGASISVGGFVASLCPGSGGTAVQLTRITRQHAASPLTSKDMQFEEAMQRYPSGSDERVRWLRENDQFLLAAAAACREDRAPILAYLSAEEEHEEAAAHDEADDPFETIIQQSQKPFEDIVSAHIAGGRIEEAVDVCLSNERFVDAFAIAYLQGGKLLQRVHQEYASFINHSSPQNRHILYASAIATGNFAALTTIAASNGKTNANSKNNGNEGALTNNDIPWREALSVIISFIGEGFATACDTLGAGLQAAGNMEGAMACYVCSGNVDAVIGLWRAQNTPVREMMREALLLEEVTGRRISSPYFAECLYSYGMKLMGDGNVKGAVAALQRAGSAGNRDAAVIVDRMKYDAHIGQVPFPYAMEPLPDAPSSSCIAHFERQQQQQQQQQQQMPQQQQQQMPQQQMGQQQQQRLGFGPPLQHQQQNQQHPPSQMPSQQQRFPPQQQQQQQQPQGYYAQPTPVQQQQQPQARLQPQGPQMPMPGQQRPAMPPPPQQQQQTQGYYAQPTPIQQQQQQRPPEAPVPRLMPHPISSYSSMKSDPPASPYGNGGPAPNAFQPSAPAQRQPPPPQQQQQQQQQPTAYAGPQATPPPPLPRGLSTPDVQPVPGVPSAMPLAPQQHQQQAYGSAAPLQGITSPQGSVSSIGGAGPRLEMPIPPPDRMMPPPPRQSGPPTASSLPLPAEGGLPGAQSRGPSVGAPYHSLSTPGAGNHPINQPMSQPTGQPMSQPMGQPMSQPMGQPMSQPMGQPLRTAAPASGYPSMLSHASPANDDKGLETFDIGMLSPAHQPIAQRLRTAVQQVSNAPRRAAVSKASIELFRMLQCGTLSPEVVGLVSNYVNSAGTPAAKNAWRQLSDQHFDAIQPFINLKFL